MKNEPTQKEKYLASIREKSAMGLKDVKYVTGNIRDASEESAYAELNRMDAAPDLPDKEVLGKYSPAVEKKKAAIARRH